MSDNWMTDVKSAYNKSKTAKSRYDAAKTKVDKVSGYIDDISKLRTFASHLMNGRVGSKSILLTLSYDGAKRLATFLPTPYLSRYLEYSQAGIDLLATIWKAKDETKMAQQWYDGLENVSRDLVKAIDEVTGEFSYAGAMVDHNQLLTRQLPRKFMVYFEHYDDLQLDYLDYMEQSQGAVDSLPVFGLGASNFQDQYLGQASENLAKERDKLGLAIVRTARDIAATHKHFAMIFAKTVEAGNRASNAMLHTRNSVNPGEVVAGKAAEKKMYIDAFLKEQKNAGTLNNAEMDLFINGRWRRMSAYRRMKDSMDEMEKLSRDWYFWALSVKSGSHMQKW